LAKLRSDLLVCVHFVSSWLFFFLFRAYFFFILMLF